MAVSENSKSGKKFLDRFRVQSTGKNEHETKEILLAEMFSVSEICRYGFPNRPTCLAFDPVQKLLAVGAGDGSIRIFGRPGVDFYLKHESKSAVNKLQFLINEGAFVSLCHDDCVHLWTIRQKRPEIVHSLQFKKEKLTIMHLPFQSKWLYLGTDKGNVHVVSIESFQLSGYVIAWNKAIDLSQRTHPGCVKHLSDCPTDDSKLLIGFASGSMVLWDLKLRQAEARFPCDQALRSVSWHYEGKQFVSGHADGSLITWTTKKPQEQTQLTYPHSSTDFKGSSKSSNSNKRRFRPIGEVEWKQTKDGDDYVVFSGGTAINEGDLKDSTCLSIIKNKSDVSVVEMEAKITNFILLCDSPYCRDAQDPYAVCVLLQNDLILVDLLNRGYPCYENPYPMDIHESPVTCCWYAADCPSDLIPAFYAVGSKQKRQGYSDKTWPIKGGECGVSPFSYPEILITGHSDGSLKFWDATAVNLQVLYKLKTSKFFDKSPENVPTECDLFAVQKIIFCQDSRQLLVSFDGGHLIFFKFSRRDSSIDIQLRYSRPKLQVLTIPVPASKGEDQENDIESKLVGNQQRQSGLKRQRSLGSLSSNSSLNELNPGNFQPLTVRNGQQKLTAGYQPDLICLIPWQNAQSPSTVTALALNSSYGLLAYGTDKSLTIVDCKRKAVILNILSADLSFRSAESSSRYLRKNNSSDSDYIHTSNEQSQGAVTSLSTDVASLSPTSRLGLSGPTPAKCGSASNLQKLRYLDRPKSQGSNLLRRPFVKAQSIAVVDDGSVDDFVITVPERDNSNRTQSSSSSSQENLNSASNGIRVLTFMESFLKKTDYFGPCLWVGTSQGVVFAVSLKVSTDQPISATVSGVNFRIKSGPVLSIGILDHYGNLLLPPAESFKDAVKNDYKSIRNRVMAKSRISSMPTMVDGPASNEFNSETTKQWLVACCEKQVDVYLLTSMHRLYYQKFDGVHLIKAEIVTVDNGPFVVGYFSTGRIVAYSLPSLRLLMDTNFFPADDVRLNRTIQFSHRGHGLFMRSPTEITKFTLSSEIVGKLGDLSGELFVPCSLPEPPKQNFLKGLIGGVNTRSLDREELFGQSSGKPLNSVAVVIPNNKNLDQLRGQSGGTANPIMAARLALNERGDKLSEVEDRTARMSESAASMSSHAAELMNVQKNKKWYQL